MSNAVAAPFKTECEKTKVGRDCNFHWETENYPINLGKILFFCERVSVSFVVETQ